MNYWPAYMNNLAETARPMVNYIDDMRYYGRIAAKEYAGIESKEGQENGWLVHTQATPFWLDNSRLELLLGLVSCCQCLDDAERL